MTTKQDPLSFWKRPEGKTGMIFLALIACGVGYALFFLLPFIIILLQNVLYAAILGVALAGLIFVLLDKRFRLMIWHGYKSVMRFITGLIIEMDPIGIMKNYLDDLVTKREDLNNQIAKVSGVKQRLTKVIGDNERSIKDSMAKASVAKKRGKDSQLQLHTRSAARLQQVNERMTPLKERLTHLLEILTKVDETVGVSIEDLKEEIRVTEMEFESMRAANKAMQQAVGALSQSGVDYEFFERAQEYVEQDVSEKIGQIDNYLRISSSIVENLDFKDEVALDRGLAMLDEWEKNGALSLGGEKVTAASDSGKARESVAEDGRIKNVFDRYRKEFQSE